MKNIRPYFKALEKFTTDNSPLILTAVGAAGVLTTAILAAKGGMEAQARLLAEEERRKWRKADDEQKAVLVNDPQYISVRDKVALTWTAYAPACGAGAFTIAAIVASNRISTKRAAAMAAAYSISLEAFDEYKEKVREKLSDRKEQAIRDEIEQDRVTKNPPSAQVIQVGDGKQLCMDSLSGRYFESDVEAIRHAVNLINNDMNHEGYASLTDFYSYLSLPRTAISDELGWTSDRLLDVDLSTAVVDEKGRTALSIVYRVQPIRDYFRMR